MHKKTPDDISKKRQETRHKILELERYQAYYKKALIENFEDSDKKKFISTELKALKENLKELQKEITLLSNQGWPSFNAKVINKAKRMKFGNKL